MSRGYGKLNFELRAAEAVLPDGRKVSAQTASFASLVKGRGTAERGGGILCFGFGLDFSIKNIKIHYVLLVSALRNSLRESPHHYRGPPPL